MEVSCKILEALSIKGCQTVSDFNLTPSVFVLTLVDSLTRFATNCVVVNLMNRILS